MRYKQTLTNLSPVEGSLLGKVKSKLRNFCKQEIFFPLLYNTYFIFHLGQSIGENQDLGHWSRPH